MKAVSILFLASTAIAFAEPSSSANYDIVVSTIDAGNGSSNSANYSITQSSLGGIVGAASSPTYTLGNGIVEALGPLTNPMEVDLTSYSSWRTLHPTFIGPETDPEDDFDNDGVTNQDEFLALTNPTDANSKLELTLLSLDSFTNTTVLQSSPFLNDPAIRIYTLLSQDEEITPSGFQPTGITPNTDASGTFTDNRVIVSKRFYRLRITIPPQS